MPGKITYALLRKEADIYRSQGLPRESLRVYENLLESAPGLPAKTQAAIRDQIQKIKIEIQCNSVDECARLSDDQIALIRQGWSEDATTEDRIVSASSFHEVGRYADALLECKALIRNGVPVDRMSGLLASCLGHLHTPENVASAAARLALEVCGDPVAGVSLQVAIAETFQQRGHINHAVSLVLSLSQSIHFAPAELQHRLAELSEELTRTRPDPPGHGPRPLQNSSCPPSGPGAGARILSALRQFARRLAGSR